MYFKLYCFLDVESMPKEGVEFAFMFEQVLSSPLQCRLDVDLEIKTIFFFWNKIVFTAFLLTLPNCCALLKKLGKVGKFITDSMTSWSLRLYVMFPFFKQFKIQTQHIFSLTILFSKL